MTSRTNALLALIMAAPLAYLYVVFLSWLVSNRVLPGANYIEAAVLLAQLIRLVVVLSVRRIRVGSVAQIFNIFMLEAFSFPILVGLYLWFGDHYLLSAAFTITAAWPSALLCVVPAYVIYRLTAGVWRDRSLVSVAPGAVFLFALLAFVAYQVGSHPAPHGLGGLSSLLLSTLLNTRSINVTPQVLLAGVPLYLSLVVYATTRDAGVSAGRNSVLLLVAFATLIAIGLATFAAYIAVSSTLVFGVPGALLVTIMWWMSRAR